MSLLQKASIITTPTAYAEDYLYSIKPAYALGENLVSNGGFDTDTDWSKTTGWTISGGKANWNPAVAPFNNDISRAFSFVEGTRYRITFTISNNTTGRILLRLSGTGNQDVNGGYTYYANGTHTVEFKAQANKNILRIYGHDSYSSFSIDDFSLRIITDADFDFDRNSTGTRVNEDYLIEDVPYNLLSYTEELTNAYWDGVNVTVTGGFQDPFYGNNAFKVVDTSGGGTAYLHEPNIADENYGRSIYARTVSGTGTVSLLSYFGNTNNDFILTEKWQRFYVNSSTTSTGAANFYAVDFRDGDLTEVLLYAPQLTKSPTLKDYLKTTDRLDIPRIDYTNGEPSILLEPSRTNLVTYSQDYSQWSNQTAPTVTSNFGISPEGITNADKITASSNTSAKFIAITLSTSTVHTGSVFLKNIDSTQSRVEVFASSYAYPVIEISWNGYIPSTLSSANATNIQYQEYTNNWWRVSYQFTTDSSITSYNTYIYPDRVNASKSILAFGSQLEVGSYATSLIHTSGSAVTRSADVANNAGNSDLFNDSEGVFYTELKRFDNDSAFCALSINDGTTNNKVSYKYRNTDNLLIASVASGGTTTDISHTFNDISEYNKIALKYKQNDFALYVNGNVVGSSTSGNAPSGLKTLEFKEVTIENYAGNVKSVMVSKEALTDLELEKLTGYNNHELYMNYYNRLSYLGVVEEYNVESDINNYIL